MLGTIKMFCIRMNILSHRNNIVLFLAYSMAAMQNLYANWHSWVWGTESLATGTVGARNLNLKSSRCSKNTGEDNVVPQNHKYYWFLASPLCIAETFSDQTIMNFLLSGENNASHIETLLPDKEAVLGLITQ